VTDTRTTEQLLEEIAGRTDDQKILEIVAVLLHRGNVRVAKGQSAALEVEQTVYAIGMNLGTFADRVVAVYESEAAARLHLEHHAPSHADEIIPMHVHQTFDPDANWYDDEGPVAT
jgi:hypothetical protein